MFKIKEWPKHDRPRERLRNLGPRALSPRELLALLIETGTPPQGGKPGRTALDLAGDLIRWFADGEGKESLRRIMTASFAELCAVPGIGPAKAGKVLAALDLGRRATEEARPDRDRLQTARDVYERMRLAMRDLPQEEFHVLLLNTQNELLRDVRISQGTVDASLVHPREVFRAALAESAAAVILVHNHPSGEPHPSPEDRVITLQLATAGNMLGIPVVDHVIIGEGRYVSFAEADMLEG
ncbi:MAG TPA: DNA repair protein RadC [Longimicrobiaceae bacterium]|nr:DNA repair protein RadC [Longimicrobiaceae bacterium]